MICMDTYCQSRCNWYSSIIREAPPDGSWVILVMHLETVIEQVGRCTWMEAVIEWTRRCMWRLESCELSNSHWRYIWVTLEISVQVIIVTLEMVVENVWRFDGCLWSSELRYGLEAMTELVWRCMHTPCLCQICGHACANLVGMIKYGCTSADCILVTGSLWVCLRVVRPESQGGQIPEYTRLMQWPSGSPGST